MFQSKGLHLTSHLSKQLQLLTKMAGFYIVNMFLLILLLATRDRHRDEQLEFLEKSKKLSN
jgi:hypothetical protein